MTKPPMMLKPQGERGGKRSTKVNPTYLHRTAKPTTIPDRVVDIIARVMVVDETECTPLTDLRADLNAVDDDIIEIVMDLEETFGLEVTPEQGDRIVTISDVIALVEKLATK